MVASVLHMHLLAADLKLLVLPVLPLAFLLASSTNAWCSCARTLVTCAPACFSIYTTHWMQMPCAATSQQQQQQGQLTLRMLLGEMLARRMTAAAAGGMAGATAAVTAVTGAAMAATAAVAAMAAAVVSSRLTLGKTSAADSGFVALRLPPLLQPSLLVMCLMAACQELSLAMAAAAAAVLAAAAPAAVRVAAVQRLCSLVAAAAAAVAAAGGGCVSAS
jgi:hypothetical protein